MLDVFSLYTQRYELIEISDHVRRIFDLVLSSNLFENFLQLLTTEEDKKVAVIKLEALRCIGLISVGIKLFNVNSNTDISMDKDNDHQFQQRLLAYLNNQNLQLIILNQINSNCLEVREQAYLTLGHMIRHGADLEMMMIEGGFLEQILTQVDLQVTSNCIRLMAWLLYIISKKYYIPPGLQNPKILVNYQLSEKHFQYV